MTRALDAITDAIRARVHKRGEDWLTATFHVVESLDDAQARAIVAKLQGRCLVRTDADLLQLAAQRCAPKGLPALVWRHVDVAGGEWGEGRYSEE